MAGERKSGAGSLASGVLERLAPPRPAAVEHDEAEPAGASVEVAETGRGRGAARADREPARRSRGAEGRAAKKIKGRTIYLPEDLFERIMVQAHRKGKTISEYVTAILERQVPDYRTARGEASEGSGEAA
jgi:hypothetical protein